MSDSQFNSITPLPNQNVKKEPDLRPPMIQYPYIEYADQITPQNGEDAIFV